MSGYSKGAEATISPAEYLGRPAVRKSRPSKSYRLPELDSRIRSVRTRNEVRMMREARRAGVRTPCVYDLDVSECSIVMEAVPGRTAKEVIFEGGEEALRVAVEIGRATARLHSAGLCHGDLTTSNVIVRPDGEICLIDFSMGRSKATVEDIGVDLRLLENAFASSHAGMEDVGEAMMSAYFEGVRDPDAVRKKLEDIRNRGRYT